MRGGGVQGDVGARCDQAVFALQHLFQETFKTKNGAVLRGVDAYSHHHVVSRQQKVFTVRPPAHAERGPVYRLGASRIVAEEGQKGFEL